MLLAGSSVGIEIDSDLIDFDLDHIYFTYNYNGLYITIYDIQHNHEVSYTRAYAIPGFEGLPKF